MEKQIVGYTHENYPVEDIGYPLSFTFFSFGPCGCPKWSIALTLEWNKTPQGQKRPYIGLHVGKWLIQSGWLF